MIKAVSGSRELNAVTGEANGAGLAVRLLLYAVASLSAFIFLHPILLHQNVLRGIPICNDDYTNLSYTWSNLTFYAVRPFSCLVISICSAIGAKGYFVTLSALTVMNVACVLLLISRLLRIQNAKLWLVFGLSALVFSVECIVHYYKYTGLMTSLCSAILALISMHCFLSAFTAVKGTRLGLIGWVFSALSLLAKEDFALPLVCFCAFFAFVEQSSLEKKAVAFKSLMLVCGSGLALFFMQRLFAHSSFLSSAGAYSISFAPSGLLLAAKFYLFDSWGGRAALAAQISSLCSIPFVRDQQIQKRLCLVNVNVFLLLAPYLLLSDHLYDFYAFNWIPWQFGSCILFSRVLDQSVFLKRVGAVVLAICILFLLKATEPRRRALLAFYREKEILNANILKTVQANLRILRQASDVNVEGIIDHRVPWFGPNEYLQNRLGIRCNWTIYASQTSDFYACYVKFPTESKSSFVRLQNISEPGRHKPELSLLFNPIGEGQLLTK